jgi:hypothetical protein
MQYIHLLIAYANNNFDSGLSFVTRDIIYDDKYFTCHKACEDVDNDRALCKRPINFTIVASFDCVVS